MSTAALQINSPVINKQKITSKLHVYIGLLILLFYCLQVFAGWRLDSLYQLQQNFIYKQLSGFVFVAILILQWRLYYTRAINITGPVRKILYSHRFYGAMSPLLLYFHAMDFGYALQLILSISFVSTILSGLLTPYTWGISQKSYVNSWLIVHVLSAATLVFMSVYHAYIVYWYG